MARVLLFLGGQAAAVPAAPLVVPPSATASTGASRQASPQTGTLRLLFGGDPLFDLAPGEVPAEAGASAVLGGRIDYRGAGRDDREAYAPRVALVAPARVASVAWPTGTRWSPPCAKTPGRRG